MIRQNHETNQIIWGFSNNGRNLVYGFIQKVKDLWF